MHLINLFTGMRLKINLNHTSSAIVCFSYMLKNIPAKHFSIGEKIREFVRKHRLSQTLEDTIN